MRKITRLVIYGYLYVHREEIIQHTAKLVKRVRGTYDSLDDELQEYVDKGHTFTLKQRELDDKVHWESEVWKDGEMIYRTDHSDFWEAMVLRPFVKIAARMHVDHDFKMKGKK